jgi:hypothetical protein
MATQYDVVDALRRIHGARFVSFTYRSAETQELARYTLLLGVNMVTLYERDRDTLEALRPTLQGLEADAADALLKSITESLEKGIGNNAAYTHGADKGATYEAIAGAPGLKINVNDGTLHVVGLVERKTVLEAGEPRKEVQSKPLTLAKRALERELRRSKIRQFRLPNLTVAKMNGDTLELGA